MKIGFAIDDPDFNPIDELHDLEMLVTARLRNASATWVRTAIELIIIAGFLFLVLASSLLFNKSPMIRYVVLNGIVMLLCLLICAFAGFPLASVAETFEYDVLR